MTNHPITKLESDIRDILFGQQDEYGPDEQIRLEDWNVTAKALTALCRQFAASELRAAAGEDETGEWQGKYSTLPLDELRKQYGETTPLQGAIAGRNELRRTLRVRAEELEAGE